MTDLQWEAVTYEEAYKALDAYWRNIDDVLAALQDSAMHDVDEAHLICVRTPWRFVRYNPDASTFETALVRYNPDASAFETAPA